VKGILHLVGGEKIVMSDKATGLLANVIRAANQSIQDMMINDGNFSVPMWNVVKIEWLSPEEFRKKYPGKK